MCLQYAKNSTMGRLDGKVCIITGATSGIGEKVVEVFLKEEAPSFSQVVALTWASPFKTDLADTSLGVTYQLSPM